MITYRFTKLSRIVESKSSPFSVTKSHFIRKISALDDSRTDRKCNLDVEFHNVFRSWWNGSNFIPFIEALFHLSGTLFYVTNLNGFTKFFVFPMISQNFSSFLWFHEIIWSLTDWQNHFKIVPFLYFVVSSMFSDHFFSLIF